MHRTSLKRIAYGLAALAASGATALALAPPASAVPTIGSSTALQQRYIVDGRTAQPAGDLKLNVTAAADTETIVISVDDSSGGSCTSADSFVAFNAAPTFSSTPADAVEKIELGESAECDAANKKDQITVTLNAIAASTDITISGIKYDTGSAVASGPVEVKVAGSVDADSSNAIISTVDRIEGANRYATAANIADAALGCPANHTAIVASGTNFPDALAANYLAGTMRSPVLLTAPNALSPETSTALKDLGIDTVIIVGGPSAVSDAVFAAIDGQEITGCDSASLPGEDTISVSRLFGETRYDTARLIATTPGAGAVGTLDPRETASCDGSEVLKTAILASGENFPDALAAGPLAYTGAAKVGCGDGKPIPLLLTPTASLSGDAAEALNVLGIQRVLILGGPAAVSDSVQTAVDNLPNMKVSRIAGANRQETARKVAEMLLTRGYSTSRGTYIARSDAFPDALVGGVLAGEDVAPLVLGNSPPALGSNVTAYLTNEADVWEVTLLGGTAALSDTVLTQVQDAILARTPLTP